ncbi:hypothetical protein ACPPVO_10070 [Dactylosporangium sp. McL0621]|uniref:hypothetical protein n=1 Tax=Dactylosporangium sp. McL0621 TaxID=3415678 RepID=UPI003CF956B0
MFHQLTTAEVVPGTTSAPLTTPWRWTPVHSVGLKLGVAAAPVRAVNGDSDAMGPRTGAPMVSPVEGSASPRRYTVFSGRFTTLPEPLPPEPVPVPVPVPPSPGSMLHPAAPVIRAAARAGPAPMRRFTTVTSARARPT